MKITVTIAALRKFNPCQPKFDEFVKKWQDKNGGKWPESKPIPIIRHAEMTGIAEFFWCFRAVPAKQKKAALKLRALALADIAERVLPIYEKCNPGKTAVRECIEGIRLYAAGKITADQLWKLRIAADVAVAAAAAAYVAYVAAAAAAAAAADAAYVAAADADAAADAAYVAYVAADAAAAAARKKEREAQLEILRKYFPH